MNGNVIRKLTNYINNFVIDPILNIIFIFNQNLKIMKMDKHMQCF